MRRLLYPSLIGMALLATAACAAEDDAGGEDGEYVLRFASYNVPDAAESQASTQWAEALDEATDGRVTVEFYYQEALLEAAETLPGVADGRADIGFVATAYYPAELPLSNVAGVPFVTADSDAQGRAFIDLYNNHEALAQEWEAQGVRVITWAPVPANIVASKEPLGSFDDLRGRQIRGYGYVSEALDMAGVNVIGMSQTEVYEALQRGVLDGTSGASMDIAVDRGFQEVAPHFVDIGYGNYAVTANVMTLSLWERLPDDIQQAITEVSDDYLEIYLAELAELEEQACDALLEAGGDVTILPEDDIREWSETAGPAIRDIWVDDVANANPEVDAQAFFDEYQSVLDEYSADSEFETAMQRCANRS